MSVGASPQASFRAPVMPARLWFFTHGMRIRKSQLATRFGRTYTRFSRNGFTTWVT
jgi:hypothetical protein